MRALATRISSEAACGADEKVKLPCVCAGFQTDVECATMMRRLRGDARAKDGWLAWCGGFVPYSAGWFLWNVGIVKLSVNYLTVKVVTGTKNM